MKLKDNVYERMKISQDLVKNEIAELEENLKHGDTDQKLAYILSAYNVIIIHKYIAETLKEILETSTEE